jgi:S1-C subfamily serine protease
VEHPFLGIQMVDITPTTKENISQQTKLNLKRDTGVLIVRVMEKSPSYQAGLREGDIIQKINGQPIQKSADVQERVESCTVGEALQMEINRNGQTRLLKVKPGAYPTDDQR